MVESQLWRRARVTTSSTVATVSYIAYSKLAKVTLSEYLYRTVPTLSSDIVAENVSVPVCGRTQPSREPHATLNSGYWRAVQSEPSASGAMAVRVDAFALPSGALMMSRGVATSGAQWLLAKGPFFSHNAMESVEPEAQ